MDSEEFKLNMNDVRELRDDMMEAYMNSRGYEKAEVELGDIEDGWIVYLFDNQFRVASTFLEARSKYAGEWTCLQDSEGREVVFPSADLVTAWKPIL
jgi:hypothetical protein